MRLGAWAMTEELPALNRKGRAAVARLEILEAEVVVVEGICEQDFGDEIRWSKELVFLSITHD